MTNESDSGNPGQPSPARKLWNSLARVLLPALPGLVVAVVGAHLGAYWGAKHAVSEQRAVQTEHAAALTEVIRFEADQNLKTLKTSTANLRTVQASLEAFLAGNEPAPDVRLWYLALGTVGLRRQMESPNIAYVPPGLVGIYGIMHGQLARYQDIQRDLNAAAVGYAAALTSAEQRRAAADMFFRIGQQLDVTTPLVSNEGILPVFLACLDQFAGGAGECEYKVSDLSPSDERGPTQPSGQ